MAPGRCRNIGAGASGKCAAMMLLLPIALAACAGSDDGSSISYTSDRNGTNQPLPANSACNCWHS
jgi:hypothetical protein